MQKMRRIRSALVLLGLSLFVGCTGPGADDAPAHDPNPQLELALDRLFFGEGSEPPVGIGSTAERPIQFFNDGEAELQIQDVTLSGAGASAFELAPLERTTFALNEPGQISVRFKPLSAGRFSATVTIRSNAHNQPEATVALQGRAE